jgi:hypothetical protein
MEGGKFIESRKPPEFLPLIAVYAKISSGKTPYQ